jgi:hypothetical protein
MKVLRSKPGSACGGPHRIIRRVCAIAALFLTQFGEAQVLRDPPTPFGPLVYASDFTHSPGPIGVSEELKNLPLGEAPGWFFNLRP